MTKLDLLHRWANNVQRGVSEGKFGKSRQQLAVGLIAGPRVAGLDLLASEDPAGLKRALNEAGGLNLAATVPWTFYEGHATVFSHGKVIRVEAPWPIEMAETNIPLRKILSAAPKHFLNGWVAGNDENGRLVVPNFYLEPHWLFAGQTGGGKSVAMTSALGQLAQVSQGKTTFILIDGKHGESLSALARMPYQVGPPAYDLESAAAALTYTVSEMGRRYSVLRGLDAKGRDTWDRETPRVVLVIDEIQTISQRGDLAAMVALLLQQGRASKINLVISTQYPLNSILGDPSMKQNLGGRVAMKMNSFDASRVALGVSEPDCTRLLGKGDAYIAAGGNFARVQIAYLNRHELAQLPFTPPEFDEWPVSENAVEPSGSSGITSFTPEAVVQSILAAKSGEGRPSLKARLDAAGQGRIGMTKLVNLLSFGRTIWDLLHKEL